MIAHDHSGPARRVDRRQRRQERRSLPTVPEGPGARPATLLLVDADDPRQLTARRNRRWARLCARLLAASLDRRLADGCPPESNRLLAARAVSLVSPDMRRVLVHNWEDLLVRAHTPPVVRDPRVPFNRGGVITREREIRRMLEALRRPLPVQARGAEIGRAHV